MASNCDTISAEERGGPNSGRYEAVDGDKVMLGPPPLGLVLNGRGLRIVTPAAVDNGDNGRNNPGLVTPAAGAPSAPLGICDDLTLVRGPIGA